MVSRSLVKDWLRAGGLDPDAERSGQYQAALDPRGAEELGRELAERLRSLDLSTIAVWRDVSDVVLAHIVGRELRGRVALLYDDDGLVHHLGVIEPGDRVAVVTAVLDDLTGLEAVVAYVERHDAEVVVIGSLLGAVDAVAGRPVVSLP